MEACDTSAVIAHVGDHGAARGGAQRERLWAIKRGEVAMEELEAWRLQLHGEFDRAFEATRLPERPDYAAVNAFLIRARRRMV